MSLGTPNKQAAPAFALSPILPEPGVEHSPGGKGNTLPKSAVRRIEGLRMGSAHIYGGRHG